MTPAARVAAAIGILDQVLAGQPAEPALIGWARASRFAGSGDRAAIRDMVFEVLRRRNSLAAIGGGVGGRSLMLGLIRAVGGDPGQVFTGVGHAPAVLTNTEAAAGLPLADVQNMHDLPGWIWPDWQTSLGPQALDIARAMQSRAPVWLRVNPRRGSLDEARHSLLHDGIETRQRGDAPLALQIVGGERKVSGSQAYQNGLVELQDLSPQLACAALPLARGDWVLDYCAGGGGKALALASCEDLRILAHDAAPSRMRNLPERARRGGVRIALSPPAELGSVYDLVVADVPCSGSGTWRRTPDAKWRLTRKGLDHLIVVQKQILQDIAPLVKGGGRIAYMTCSLLDAENGGQVDDFLRMHPDFSEESRHGWNPLVASDGFFLSVLRRNGAY
ncbi:MAG: RsmB/NOP family class I SAM-dependent RNA methyltransferase [Paracoccus sp. (in: a-proteobacteria)]